MHRRDAPLCCDIAPKAGSRRLLATAGQRDRPWDHGLRRARDAAWRTVAPTLTRLLPAARIAPGLARPSLSTPCPLCPSLRSTFKSVYRPTDANKQPNMSV